MSSVELIGNLQVAIQSQEAAEQAFEDWQLENERNEAALAAASDSVARAMERRSTLLAEKAKREHDLTEGRKHAAKANEAWWQFCREQELYAVLFPEQAPPLPASPAPSPAPGAPKKGGRKPYSPEQKVAAAARSAQKKATRQRLIAEGNAEAIAEQAKIDAQVARMQAGRKAKQMKAILPTDDMLEEGEISESELDNGVPVFVPLNMGGGGGAHV
jgi:hypothetical protein